MSQFNPLNTQHVMALVFLQTEVKVFGAVSDYSQGRAEALGLVPSDFRQLDAVFDNIEALNKLAEEESDRFASDTGFAQALIAGGKIAAVAAMTELTVEIAAKRGLARVDNEGELRWNADMANPDSDAYKSLLEEVFAEFNRVTSLNNNEENDEQQQGSQQGSGVADSIRVEEEQEEDHDGAGDVSVSAPRAA
jgi:hypothetical protein